MMMFQSISAKLVRIVRVAGIAALVLFLGATTAPKKAARTSRPNSVRVRTITGRVGNVTPTVSLLYDIASEPDPIAVARQLRKLRMEVTAYCPCKKCCGPNAAGVTASGHPVSYNAGRFVAADTDVLPFGTKVLIPGYDAGPVEVIDRGSAIRGNRIDVYFPTHEKALEWGRQSVEVMVVE